MYFEQKDVWGEILSHLTVEDLVSFRLVSKGAHTVLEKERIWRTAYERDSRVIVCGQIAKPFLTKSKLDFRKRSLYAFYKRDVRLRSQIWAKLYRLKRCMEQTVHVDHDYMRDIWQEVRKEMASMKYFMDMAWLKQQMIINGMNPKAYLYDELLREGVWYPEQGW
jgi:hypothetical protein